MEDNMTNYLFDMIKKVKYTDILHGLVEELRKKIVPEELEITSMAVAYSSLFIGDLHYT